MDEETLTNHISKLGKNYFDNACKLVLEDIFNSKAINVDGKGDGGTDFTVFSDNGDRKKVAYQITTQKTSIKNKAYKDAKKALGKLQISKFYFFTTFIMNETSTRKLEFEISDNLNINCTCLSANNIAGLILSDGLLNKFLSDSNYPLPRNTSQKLDYREMALHSYTLFSEDASKLKYGIYEDTILLVINDNINLDDKEIAFETCDFLGISKDRCDEMTNRIGALFGKKLIKRNENGFIELSSSTSSDLYARKNIYGIELESITSAQIDILRNEFNVDWNKEDSTKVALWIANAFISNQISNLKEIKASIVSNPLFNVEEKGLDRLKIFLISEKEIDNEKADDIIEKLLENASDHPLITKLSRASIYLALEGRNPMSSAKALGAERWSEFRIMVEPTVAIPYICSLLYKGSVNKDFNNAIKSINQAIELDAQLNIPFFYINECASHLLKARNYCFVDLNFDELVFSSNAFIANYFALKKENRVRMPGNLMDYLCSFSSSIRNERKNTKDWIRSIMTDIQSMLVKNGINFIDVPFYEDGDCEYFEKEYMYKLEANDIDKRSNLIKHDTYALKFTNDKIINDLENWIILTYDKSMISVSQSNIYNGWIANPVKFLDFTETTKPLSEAKLISLVHSVATYSEKTLSVGARIIDRVIKYASKEMQNWEFKNEIENFKNDLIRDLDFNESDYENKIDKKTDEFLEKYGINQNDETSIDV